MKLIPNYRVCYKGVFYGAFEAFEIDPLDQAEMNEHGKVVDEAATDPLNGEKPRRGRPPKEGKNG